MRSICDRRRVHYRCSFACPKLIIVWPVSFSEEKKTKKDIQDQHVDNLGVGYRFVCTWCIDA